MLERALLGLQLASFQQRIASIAAREKQAVVLDVKQGVLHDCAELHAALTALRQKLVDKSHGARLDVRLDLKSRFEPSR